VGGVKSEAPRTQFELIIGKFQVSQERSDL
jgi:hypothetical protein